MEYRLIKTRGFAGLIPYKKQNKKESKIWQGGFGTVKKNKRVWMASRPADQEMDSEEKESIESKNIQFRI